MAGSEEPPALTQACPLQDPLGWELWAMAELNAAVSINWARLSAFSLQPTWTVGPLPIAQALQAFHDTHGYGAPSRSVQVVLARRGPLQVVPAARARVRCEAVGNHVLDRASQCRHAAHPRGDAGARYICLGQHYALEPRALGI